MKTLLLDMDKGGVAETNRTIILLNKTHIQHLLRQIAALYGLVIEMNQEYEVPQAPVGKGYWLEIADDDDNIICKVTYASAIKNPDRTQPVPRDIGELLNGYCRNYELPMRVYLTAA